VAQQPNSGLSRLIVEGSRSHTIRHTTPGRNPLGEWLARPNTASYTAHNQHNERTAMLSAGFNPAIQERLQTYALDRRVTVWLAILYLWS
jgi:hypothetical protein